MSQTGALVEAKMVPNVNDPVTLLRGSLKAAGTAVWRTEERFGVAFSSPVDVGLWLPDGCSGQTRVDVIVDEMRGHRQDTAESLGEIETIRGAVQSPIIIAELIRAVGHKLANDTELVARFSSELQAFDIAAQAVEAMCSQQPGSQRRLQDSLVACRQLLAAIEPVDAYEINRSSGLGSEWFNLGTR